MLKMLADLRLLIANLIFGVTLILAQQTTKDNCFQSWPNLKVNCLTAYNQQTGLTNLQCRDLCIQNAAQCRAVQYDSVDLSCQLFQTAVSRRKRNPDGHARNRRHGCHQGGRSSNQHEGGGGHGGRPPPHSGEGRPPPRGPPPGPPHGPPPGPPPRSQGRNKRGGGGGGHSHGHGCGPTGGGGGCTPGLQTANGYTYYKPTGQCSGSTTTAAPNLPPGATCPPGQVARYYLVDGYQLSSNPDFTFAADSEQACIDACTNNHLPDGRTAPCRSFDFDTQSRQCSISFQPTGTPSSSPNSNLKHYEKACVDGTFGGRCPGPYFRGPQKILVGYAQAVVNANSNTECLQICADAQARFGFACQSVLFYYQEQSNNCILNSETRTSQPDKYISENNDKVDYFEPGCTPTRVLRQARPSAKRNRNVIKPNSPDYSGWTMCDHRLLDHKRFRSCSGMNPNKCQMDRATCDPAKEDDYDRPDPEVTSGPPTVGGNTGLPNFDTTTTTQRFGIPFSSSSSAIINVVSGITWTTRKIDTNRCEPAIKPDGSKDCENGSHRGDDGNRQKCRPSKDEC